jgi:hypothetical protein
MEFSLSELVTARQVFDLPDRIVAVAGFPTNLTGDPGMDEDCILKPRPMITHTKGALLGLPRKLA